MLCHLRLMMVIKCTELMLICSKLTPWLIEAVLILPEEGQKYSAFITLWSELVPNTAYVLLVQWDRAMTLSCCSTPVESI